MATPQTFKAAKRRKTPLLGREASPGVLVQPQCAASAAASECSDDHEELEKLIIGVARIVSRHIAEGQTRTDAARPGGVVAQRTTPVAQRPLSWTQSVGSHDFYDESFFLPAEQPRRCFKPRRCCFWPRRQEVQEPIAQLLRDMTSVGSFPKELVVLSAIYIERLLSCSSVRLTTENWRSILVAAMFIASKVWEDVHLWNVDFAVVLKTGTGLTFFNVRSVYRLETVFLKALSWQVSVYGEQYAAYLFALRDADTPATPPHFHGQQVLSLRRSCSWSGMCDMETPLVSIHEVSPASTPRSVASTAASTMDRRVVSRTRSWTPAAQATPATETQTSGMTSGMSRSRSCGNSLHSMGQASEVNTSPQGEVPQMEDMGWVDRTNPFIGTFRHAPKAMPPSRHINGRSTPSFSDLPTTSAGSHSGMVVSQSGTSLLLYP